MVGMDDTSYSAGFRSAMLTIMGTCKQHLGQEGALDAMILEREGAIRVLRSLCDEHGDNDWPDDLHLADIIEKHLGRYLV